MNETNAIYNHLIPFKKDCLSLFEVCHRLKTFSFSCDRFDEEELPLLFEGNNNSIRNIKFNKTQKYYRGNFFLKLFTIFSFKNLEKIDISSDTIVEKEEIYAILRNYPFLKELNLSSCHFEVADEDHIDYILHSTKSKIVIKWC